MRQFATASRAAARTAPQARGAGGTEPYSTIIQLTGAKLYDFQRERDDTMAAQRQLLAYHAKTIGGDYGELLSYKPYKQHPLTTPAGAKYLNAKSLRSWSTVERGAIPDAPTLAQALAQAVARAPEIAAKSAKASQDRPKNKGRNKGEKAQLTEQEIAAIRAYTSDDYREMNAVFRDYRLDRPTANWGKYSAIAKLAISGMGKLPEARGIISYRGDNALAAGRGVQDRRSARPPGRAAEICER